MIPTPTKRRNYQQQEYPAQDELEDEEDENENENENENKSGNEEETNSSEANKEGVLFNGFSINKKRCINNQQTFKGNKCCGQFAHTQFNAASVSVDDYDESEECGEELGEEEEEELGVVAEDEDEDFDYLRLDTIVEEDENSDMEDDEDLGHLDGDDSDFECDNNDDRKLVTKTNAAQQQQQQQRQRQQKGKASAAYASVAPKGLLNEEAKQFLGQKQQKNGENNNNNNNNDGGSKVRPLAEHHGGNLLLNSMRKFSATSTNHQQTTTQRDENVLNKEQTITKQSIQDEEKSDSSSKCDKLTSNTKKMQTRQQQQNNQIHPPLPSTNRLISEHQARQQQALFRALAERQKMMDEIGADERIDLMSTASLSVLRQQQQKQQQQSRRKRRRAKSSAVGRGDKNRLNSSSKNNKPEGPSSSSSIEDGVPLSAVDLSSMSDRMLDELLGHIASASSSSLSSNGESIDSSDLSSGNSSGDELDGGSQRLRSNVSASLSEAPTTTRTHNRMVSSNQLSDTPNIIGVHEDERTRTNGCIINNNLHQTNNGNHFTQALNNKAKRQLNCRNTHRRSCDNEDDQNDDDEDDDDNNDHELVVHLNNTSDQLHDSSLSPINHKVSEHQHNSNNNYNKKRPNSSNINNKSSKLEEYFTSGLVNPHEFSEGSESPESVTASNSSNKLLTSRQQQQQHMISSKQAPTSACKATASSASSKQSVEEVLSQMLGALNEISADDQEQLNDLLERGFTHLEQLLNCNLGGGGNSNLASTATSASSPVGSVTNQLTATSTTTTATTLSTTNTSSLNQRQRQQHINTIHSNPLLTRSQQPNNMAQKLISNQQQQQQQQQLSQSNAATLSKDSDYGSDTQSADCFSHYNDSSASSSNEHPNFTNISNQSSSSNGRWTMVANNQHSGDVQSSESPSPTSLTATSCSSTSAQHCSSSSSSSPIIGGGKTTPSMPSSTITGRATAITVTSGANSNSTQPNQSMSTLSPLAIELSFKLAESLHRLAQQQAATRRDAMQTSAGLQQQQEQHDEPPLVHVASSEKNNTCFSSNGNGCVNLSSDIKHESDIEKQQPIVGSTTMQKVAPQPTQKKSPMKSIVMINATRSPSAASIVSTSSSSNDFVSVQQQQQQQQQLQRNLTPVQGGISTSSPSCSPSFGEVNINKQSSTSTTTKQQFKTCVSIGSSSGVSSVLVGSTPPISTTATPTLATITSTKDNNSKKCEDKSSCEGEVTVSPKKNRRTREKRVGESIVNDCDDNEDLKSNIREELKNNKCQDSQVLDREKERISSENIKQQKAAISTAAVNFERARSSRSSLRRRPSFSGSTCSTKEPGAPRPGSPVPRPLLEEPRGLNYASSEMKNMNTISNNSSNTNNNNIGANNSLVTEHKKQQKQLQRALILAQKYNYSPTKLAASKLSSKLQLKDLTATSAPFNALSSSSSSPSWTANSGK